MMQRYQLINNLAEIIVQIDQAHPVRVAIDGVDAAGKTTLADELAKALAIYPRQVIRVSLDGFHQPKTIRRHRGALSPEGFYRDSYQYPTLIKDLLLPLGPNGSWRYRTAVFDIIQDQHIADPVKAAQPDTILLMDGIFLLRPELLLYWDLSIFLQADFSETVPRGIARDKNRFGSSEAATIRYKQRYVPGQEIYFKEACPLDKADILIDNNNLEEPELLINHVK